MRSEQARFGLTEDFSHLQTSLNIDDLEEIKTKFRLKGDCELDDLQRFASLFTLRQEQYGVLFNEMKVYLETGEDSGNQTVLLTKGMFSAKQHRDYMEKKHVAPKLRLAILYHDPGFLKLEAGYLARFLNFVSPLGMLESKTLLLYLNLFRLITPPNQQIRVQLRRLWGNLDSYLRNFKPVNLISNYNANRDAFFKEAKKIVKKKLD